MEEVKEKSTLLAYVPREELSWASVCMEEERENYLEFRIKGGGNATKEDSKVYNNCVH